jgi:hypothetical protein
MKTAIYYLVLIVAIGSGTVLVCSWTNPAPAGCPTYNPNC